MAKPHDGQKPRRPCKSSIYRRVWAIAATLVVLAAAAVPSAASAHSLTSSTIAVRVGDGSAEATISVAEETLERALGTEDPTDAEVLAYLDEHLTLTGADGSAWTETYGEVGHESVEGIDSISVDVSFDAGAAGTGRFTVDYDAIIEAIPTHEAVVVLTDSAGEISSPGVITANSGTLAITDGTQPVPLMDMLHYGFEHVLEGADHLLFLLTLLLVAPLVAVAGRWRRNDGLLPTAGRVVHVVTAFTLGHSLTLIAAALGWVTVPSRPVEIPIAGLALAAATGWALDRFGVVVNPLTGVEDFAIAHPQIVVIGLAAVAAAAWLGELPSRRLPRAPAKPQAARAG